MTWDYAEAPPFGNTSGNWLGGIEWIARALVFLPVTTAGQAGLGIQADAANQLHAQDAVVSTDPPYYDNIAYQPVEEGCSLSRPVQAAWR